MKRVFLLLAAAMLLGASPAPSPASSQSGTISGSVVDGRGKSIAGAIVNAAGGGQLLSTVSAANGAFSLSAAPGLYVLTVAKGGFEKAEDSNVVVTAGASTPFKVTLVDTTISNLRVIGTVSTSASAASSSITPLASITADTITERQVPSLQEVLPELPGVTFGERGGGTTDPYQTFTIRGAPIETRIEVDGHPVSTGISGLYDLSQVNPGVFCSIDVDKGAGIDGADAGESVIGTVNLRTCDFTAKNVASAKLGLDQFDAQFSSFNLSGNVGSAQRFSYVLSYNVAGVIGPEHGQYGYDVQPDPNNPGYGLAVFGSPLNDDVNQRSELAKFRYRLSESTSITAAFIGFQGEQNPQGVAYGSYVGPTTIESSISTPNTGAPPTVNYNAPGLQDLVGRTVPGYVWYPGTYTSTSQPFFEAELRSAIGKNDTLLVRPYAAVITRFVDGNEEASFPGAWTQGPASAYVEQYQSAYDEIESERLHGATLTYLHPYGEDNVVNFSYDYHSLFSSDYYGYPQLQINVAPTTARTSDFSLSTLLTIAPKVKLALGDYETSWNLDYLAGASASSLASFTRTVAHNDPHLGLNWRPNPKFALRFSAGSGITVPYADQVSGLPSVSNGNSGVNTLETVNPNLKPEVTVAYDLGTDIELPGRNKLSFDVYDDTIHDTFVASTYAVPPSYLAGFPNPYQIVSTWLNGPAQRDDGIELALGSGRRFGLGYDANVTFQRAYYDLLPQSFYALAASTAINGAQIDGIPFTTAHGEVNWTGHEGNLRAAFGADYVGQNNWTNGGGFVTFYSALRRDVGHLGTLQVSVSNLFNKGTGAPYGFGVYNGGFARPEYGPDAAGTGLGYSAVPQFLQSIPPLTIRFSLAKQVGW
jgi:hypothetical protein